uniref:Uncharacterized protein n=1 Tax=Anguilla anguilla TaxID=7936 RepID=A0A0E9WJ67_ANGAN
MQQLVLSHSHWQKVRRLWGPLLLTRPQLLLITITGLISMWLRVS